LLTLFVFVRGVAVCRLQQQCQLGRNDPQPDASSGGRSENLCDAMWTVNASNSNTGCFVASCGRNTCCKTART
jgi:hypothetical protein